MGEGKSAMRFPHMAKDQADDGGGLSDAEREQLAHVRDSPEVREHEEQLRTERRRAEFARWLYYMGHITEWPAGLEHDDDPDS